MAGPSGFTYRAFISYSHRDKAWADWLHKALETYRVPSRLVGTKTAHGTIPRRLNPVFRDRDELSSSPELGTRINEALARSENLIVICSPASAASRWVNQEVLAYKHIGRAARIFCLIVDGEPNAADLPGHKAEECFCPTLRFATDADGRPTSERAEPIAADARAGKDGKPNAKLKLIAGMLDVGFDALKQREQRRQLQRMTAIAGIALVVMAVTIVLAIAALVSRHRAVVAQHEAVIAKQAAVRRQKQAEDLVDFMLGNLSDKLEAESRLDIMQDVNNHAMAYFDSLPSTDINDTELAQRAQALDQIGLVRMNVGNLPGALQAYRASAVISSALAAAKPKDVARQVTYSQTLTWIGMIRYEQNDLKDAEHQFETARSAIQPSLIHAPNNLPLLQQLTYLDSDLDHVLVAQKRSDAAVRLTLERLQLDERLVAAKPTDVDYVQDLGDAHDELGRLALQRGDLAMAIAEYRADDAVETHLSESNPASTDQRGNMARARAILGRTLVLIGDTKAGLGDLQYSVSVEEALTKFDIKNTDSRFHCALYSSQFARVNRESGNLHAATELTRSAVSMLEALDKKDPSNSSWRSDYANSLVEQAKELQTAGQPAAARLAAQHALDILAPMLAKHSYQRESLLAMMEAKLLLASLTNDLPGAQNAREQALQTMQAETFDIQDPRLLALQVQAMLALNRRVPAQPLIKQLWNEGYREPEFVDSLDRSRIDYPENPEFRQKLLAAIHAVNNAAEEPAAHSARP